MSKTIEEAAEKFAEKKFPNKELYQKIAAPALNMEQTSHLPTNGAAWRTSCRKQTDGTLVLGWNDNKVYICAHDGEDWYNSSDNKVRPTHWLPIPSLNPEQR